MIRCDHCDQKNDETRAYCAHCGAPLRDIEPMTMIEKKTDAGERVVQNVNIVPKEDVLLIPRHLIDLCPPLEMLHGQREVGIVGAQLDMSWEGAPRLTVEFYVPMNKAMVVELDENDRLRYGLEDRPTGRQAKAESNNDMGTWIRDLLDPGRRDEWDDLPGQIP